VISGLGDDGRAHAWRRLPQWTEDDPEELARVCDGVVATDVQPPDEFADWCGVCAKTWRAR